MLVRGKSIYGLTPGVYCYGIEAVLSVGLLSFVGEVTFSYFLFSGKLFAY